MSTIINVRIPADHLPYGFGQNRPVQEEEEKGCGGNDDDKPPVSKPEGQAGNDNLAEREVELDDHAAVHSLLLAHHLGDENKRDEEDS